MNESNEVPQGQDFAEFTTLGLASPKDRLAAYAIDCILLLPIVQLVQAPVKRLMFESYIFDLPEYMGTLQLVNFALFVLIFIFYYTFLTWKGGQTFGKKFFHIKVVSYHGKISLYNAFVRSIFIFFEILLGGYSFIALFTHNLRRPLHDRAADTLVMSTRSPVGFPNIKEKWQAFIGATLFTGLVTIFFVTMAYINISDRWFEANEALGYERCGKYITKKNNSTEEALEFYLAGKISSKCLHDLARHQLWQRKQMDQAQLAMFISMDGSSEKSKKYWNEICNTNSEGKPCQFVQWIQLDFNDVSKVSQSISQFLKNEKVEEFYKIYFATFLHEKGQYKDLENVLAKMNVNTRTRPFMANMSFRSFVWQKKWVEALWLFKTHGIHHDELLDFLHKSQQLKQVDVKDQLKILTLFYPALQANKLRGIASLSEVPQEVQVYHSYIRKKK